MQPQMIPLEEFIARLLDISRYIQLFCMCSALISTLPESSLAVNVPVISRSPRSLQKMWTAFFQFFHSFILEKGCRSRSIERSSTSLGERPFHWTFLTKPFISLNTIIAIFNPTFILSTAFTYTRQQSRQITNPANPNKIGWLVAWIKSKMFRFSN